MVFREEGFQRPVSSQVWEIIKGQIYFGSETGVKMIKNDQEGPWWMADWNDNFCVNFV